jgi:hypothetical protein
VGYDRPKNIGDSGKQGVKAKTKNAKTKMKNTGRKRP